MSSPIWLVRLRYHTRIVHYHFRDLTNKVTDSPFGEEQYLTAEQVRSLVREELLKAGVIEPEREQGYSIPMNLKKAR